MLIRPKLFELTKICFGRYALCDAIYTCFQIFLSLEQKTTKIFWENVFSICGLRNSGKELVLSLYFMFFQFLVFELFSKSTFVDTQACFPTNLTPQFQNRFPYFFSSSIFNSSMLRNMCKLRHKVCDDQNIPP